MHGLFLGGERKGGDPANKSHPRRKRREFAHGMMKWRRRRRSEGKREKGRGGMDINERDATKGERRRPVIWRGNYLQFVLETKAKNICAP